MKKTMLLGVLMLSAAAGYAQESRQDVSFSGTGIFGPTVHGAANVKQQMTGALGLLLLGQAAPAAFANTQLAHVADVARDFGLIRLQSSGMTVAGPGVLSAALSKTKR